MTNSNSGLKEIMRIIIDSVSASKLVQHEVTISDNNKEQWEDGAIDMTSMLEQEMHVVADAGEEEVSDHDGSLDEESDVSCNFGEAASHLHEQEGDDKTDGDHSYYVQTAANEQSKQAAIDRQCKRTRRYAKRRKPQALDVSVSEATEKAMLETMSTISRYEQHGDSETVTNVNQTTVAGSVHLDTVKRVMSSVALVSGSRDGPQEIHVRVQRKEAGSPVRVQRKEAGSPVRVQHKEAGSEHTQPVIRKNNTELKMGKVSKLLTCAYCGEEFESTQHVLAHYDSTHDDGLEDLIARSVTKMSAKVRERMCEYNVYGIAGVECKSATARATPVHEADAEECIVCRLCYYKFKESDYEAHILLQHYWARMSAMKKHGQEARQDMTRLKKKHAVPVCCEECGRVFNMYEAFCAHMWEVHEIAEYRKEAIPEVKRHARTVPCGQCGKYFKNKHSLQCHVSEFHTKGVVRVRQARVRHETLRCDLCAYTTPEARRLKAHISKVHLGVNSYKCPFCTYTTSEQTALRHHKYTHTATKPIACNYCNFKCVQKHDIRSHLKRCHGIVVDSIRSLKFYNGEDLDLARKQRNAAIDEQRRHFSETKDLALHSCRGNEYYGEPYGEDNFYQHGLKGRNAHSLVHTAFPDESCQIDANSMEYYVAEDVVLDPGPSAVLDPGPSAVLDPGPSAVLDPGPSAVQAHQAPQLLAMGAEDAAYSSSVAAEDVAYSSSVAGEDVAYSSSVAGEDVAYSSSVGAEDVAYSSSVAAEDVAYSSYTHSSTNSDREAYVSASNTQFILQSGFDVGKLDAGLDGGSAHRVTCLSDAGQAREADEATFMIEIGTDESGNTKYAMLTNEQLGALTQNIDIKTEALDAVLSVPLNTELVTAQVPPPIVQVPLLNNTVQNCQTSHQFVEVTSQFAEVTSQFAECAESLGDNQSQTWNSQAFSLNYETGIPTDYSA